MTLAVAVLPLRTTIPRQDLANMISNYLEATPSIGLSPQACRPDLKRLQELRARVSVQSKEAYEDVDVDDLHEYYNCLLECETKGIVGSRSDEDALMRFEWESALTEELQCQGSLQWERANVLWNLATLEAFRASKQTLDCKVSWSQAAQQFQNAASWLQHLPPTVGDVFDFSDTFLEFWQAFLMALSQRCVYESLACAPRPRHLLLAKLAAAAVPLYGELESILRQDEESQGLLGQVPSITNHWADYARAWGMYMSSKAEYHQAVVGREKKQWGLELARLDLAYRFASLCGQYCERAPLSSLEQLHTAVAEFLNLLHERLHQARHENETTHQQPVPPHQDLPEIRGEKLVNIDQPLTKLLKPMQGEPMFQQGNEVMDSQNNFNFFVDRFHSEMDQLVHQLATMAEQNNQSARATLAKVNLPHSLTAYEQQLQGGGGGGGGIPIPLWDRVEMIQRQHRIARLKQDLWELRDVAEVARTTFQKIGSQLDFDLETDKFFRKENPSFQGRDAEEVQKNFRQSLEYYGRLLKTAQEGDAILLQRLEHLDTNPKYKLLQFQKSQLDRLMPGSNCGGRRIDTSKLSRLVVELSKLLKDRETLQHTLHQEIQQYDIQKILEGLPGSDQDYEQAINYAKSVFNAIVFELQSNFGKQEDLLRSILTENERFVQARDQRNNGAADSCIAMIEDAVEEIEQLSSHLSEGKTFYDTIIPELESLKQKVGDVSARLTIERIEYDDQLNRHRQEAADAEFAKRMSGDAPTRLPPPPTMSPPPRYTGPIPNNVDEQKVATLVAMDFDPARVVAALAKHKNNVEQAVNELLS